MGRRIGFPARGFQKCHPASKESGRFRATGHYKRTTTEDAKRWSIKYRDGVSILGIAKEEGVDPGTVSSWLHNLGLEIKQGQHLVPQPPLRVPQSVVKLVGMGPERLTNRVESGVFGLQATRAGIEQLEKYCRFIYYYKEGKGVEEIARMLGIHRSTVAEWRNGTDTPYLVKVASATSEPTRPGWKWLPLTLSSGGNSFENWVQVPASIAGYEDVTKVVSRLCPLEDTYARGKTFGLSRSRIDSMRPELFAYLLGFMLGDASKLGGKQERFSSMNIDLQLSLKRKTNLRLGEFVCMCANSLGLQMDRITDKQPTGDSRLGQQPMGAFRWTSQRTPLLAWAFVAGLGLDWSRNTSYTPVRMEWIFATPFAFRMRFAQGVADSDACVKKYVVEITSLPNAEFVKRLLWSVGLMSAYVRIENGLALRTVVRAIEAADLPLINEFTNGYRYEQLMRYKRPSGLGEGSAG